MDLTKWDSLVDIENIVDRALNWSNARFTPALPLGGFGPRVDIHESDNSYMIKADMPGVDKEALSVGIDGEMLTIQGQRGRESLGAGLGFTALSVIMAPSAEAFRYRKMQTAIP